MKVEYSLKDYVIAIRNLIEELDKPAGELNVDRGTVKILAFCSCIIKN